MYEYSAQVLRVVDGDTVDLAIDLGFFVYIRERVRLLGIDTPEIRTKDLEEKRRGYAAAARLTEMLQESVALVVKTQLHQGKFGRTLGTLYVTPGVGSAPYDVNQRLLDEGHAVPYRS
jgi:micrococcal nuclease